MVMKSFLTTAAIAGIAASLYSSYRRRSGGGGSSQRWNTGSSNAGMGRNDDAGLAQGMSEASSQGNPVGRSSSHRSSSAGLSSTGMPSGGMTSGNMSSPGTSTSGLSSDPSQDDASWRVDHFSSDRDIGRTDDLLSPANTSTNRSSGL